MSGRNRKTAMRALALAAPLVGGVAASDMASAQQVIMLETIGAVRMAQPDEVRRMATEQESARPRSQEQPRRQEQEASAH